jgi:CBS domain-containing protein
MKISRILATKGTGVITILPNQSVREAIALMDEHNIGALIVVEERDKPVGIISERDIIRHAVQDENLFAYPVEKLMTTNLVTALPQDDLESVANTMTERRFRHLPIIDQGQLIGIVSIGDVVKAQRDELRGVVDTLQSQIIEDEEGDD